MKNTGNKPEKSETEKSIPSVQRLKLAYLTTKYPSVSHTFIRRELREIEQRGHTILRVSIRRSDAKLVDSLDQDEDTKTIHCLAMPFSRHTLALLRTAFTRPVHFLNALRTTVAMGRRSDRGVLKHLAYLIEACTLLEIFRENAIQHIHVHFGTNPAAVARLIRRLGGPSYSFTVHGPDEFDAAIAFDLRGKIADAAFVVAITDYCAAQLRRWSKPSDWPKIHNVHCTVGDDFFVESEPITPDNRTFVCVGRLAPQKGQLILLEAFTKLIADGQDARLVFVGDGEMRSVIEERIATNHLEDKVEITGYVSEAVVRKHIAASRALALPSFAEGLPMVIMEAFAVGRPIISTYIAGIPELVRPKENGWLVPAGNIDRLASALNEVLETPVENLTKMATLGRDATYQQHHTVTEVDRLEALFNRYTCPTENNVQKKRVLAIASGGGHWVQLLRLRPAFAGQKVCYVTVDPEYANDVPDCQFFVINDATRWEKVGLVKLALRIFIIILRVRPHVVISTGAACGYFALRFGKLIRARTIWLDSIANVEEISMTGQLVKPYADLWLTQWPELARSDGPDYRGAVL